MRTHHARLLALVLVLGAVVTYLFFARIGPERLIPVLREADLAYLSIAVSIFLASCAFGALGLWYLLDRDLSRGFLLKAYFVGYFLNNITPAAGYGGELAKAEIIARKTGKPRTKVFAAVIIQKILHFTPFIVSLFLSAVFLEAKGALGKAGFIAGVAAAVSAVLGIVIIVFISRRPGPAHLVCRVIESILSFFEKIEVRILPSHIFSRAKSAVREFHTTAHQMFWKRSVAMPAAFTFLALVSEVTALSFVLISLGQAVPAPAIILSYTIAVLIGMIPVTPGGLGTYETTLAGMLFLLGVPLSVAAAASLMFRLIQYWMTNAIGIVALARINK